MNQKELIDKIVKASEHIHKQTLKGSGNWIIVSPTWMKIYEKFLKREERKDKLNKIKKASK